MSVHSITQCPSCGRWLFYCGPDDIVSMCECGAKVFEVGVPLPDSKIRLFDLRKVGAVEQYSQPLEEWMRGS